MRKSLLFIGLICLPCILLAQSYFPIKVDNKWGLMDAEGDIFLDPKYDAIGEFKKYGYAVMQRAGGVGLLNLEGSEIVMPQYDDLKVLDSTLVAVMDHSEWMVIDLDGNIVLDKGYDRVHVWKSKYLAYLKNDKWGLSNSDGKTISEPKYDQVELLEEGYFQTELEGNFGLISLEGELILNPSYESVKIYNDQLFFYQFNKKWGASNRSGLKVIAPQFNYYQAIGTNFLKLVKDKINFLYSITGEDIISTDDFHNFYQFNDEMVLTKKDRLLGLMKYDGTEILPPEFNEIFQHGSYTYRVRKKGKWGIIQSDGVVLLDYIYDYIAPLEGMVSIVLRDANFGIINALGEEVAEPIYSNIEFDGKQAKAYQGEALTLFAFDEEGRVKDENNFKKHLTITIGKEQPRRIVMRGMEESNYLLDKFEWFYSSREDRWGLRAIKDGSIKIKPTYDWIQIRRDLGFTVVGIEKMTYHTYDRTEYRYHMVYGLVNNEVGMLTTMVDMWDIRLSDFNRGLPVARCVFDNGRHGLISKIGKVIRKDYAYIGSFKNGMARMSIKGKLSGNLKNKSHAIEKISTYQEDMLSSHMMVDFTKFDKEFNKDASLTCEECYWGYMDTLGRTAVQPNYTFALDFVNEVGIVKCGDKWGAVSNEATTLIPCDYDGVGFLENTDNQILKISINRKKYGLIDTLGQVAVSLMYDAIGDFSENRLAVQRNGKWGFVNENGLEIIPCIYDKVTNFSDGYSVVKKGRKNGAINKNGDVKIEFKYNYLGSFNNGLASFSDSSGKGYLNKEGAIAIEPIFQRVYDFEDGVARVMKGGEFGLIDTTGNYVLRPKYGNIDAFNEYGLAVVRYGSNKVHYGLLNKEGKMITDKNYRSIEWFSEGMAVVRYKDNYGFINTKGSLVINNIYSKASSFKEGRAAVQKDGQCGYIDLAGREVIKFEYSKCLDFEDGRAVVYKGYRKAGLVDINGNYIIEPSINRIMDFTEGRGLVRDNNYRFYYITEQARSYEGFYQRAGEFNHGVAVVQIDGRWGIINQKGIEIIPPKYDKIDDFENGYAKVRITEFSGLTNLKGDLIVQPDYEYISYAGEGLFRVEQGDKIGYFDAQGEWVWGLRK